MCEKENEIKFHYAQDSACLAMIVYDNRLIYNSIKVLCNVDMIHAATGCYGSAGKHLHNDLAKKSGKTHVMPVVPVAMPLEMHP